MTPPYSTENSTCDILNWIVVSHCPDDVTVSSSSSPPDIHPGDQFTQPSVQQSYDLLVTITTNLLNVQDQCIPSVGRGKLCKKALKLH